MGKSFKAGGTPAPAAPQEEGWRGWGQKSEEEEKESSKKQKARNAAKERGPEQIADLKLGDLFDEAGGVYQSVDLIKSVHDCSQ